MSVDTAAYTQILDITSRNAYMAWAFKGLTRALQDRWLDTPQGQALHHEYLMSRITMPPECFIFDYCTHNPTNYRVRWDNIKLFLDTSRPECTYVGGLPDYNLINPYNGCPTLYTMVEAHGRQGDRREISLAKLDRAKKIKIALRLTIVSKRIITDILNVLTHENLVKASLDVTMSGHTTSFYCCPILGGWSIMMKDGTLKTVFDHNLERIRGFMVTSRPNVIDYLPLYTVRS